MRGDVRRAIIAAMPPPRDPKNGFEEKYIRRSAYMDLFSRHIDALVRVSELKEALRGSQDRYNGVAQELARTYKQMRELRVRLDSDMRDAYWMGFKVAGIIASSISMFVLIIALGLETVK